MQWFQRSQQNIVMIVFLVLIVRDVIFPSPDLVLVVVLTFLHDPILLPSPVYQCHIWVLECNTVAK